MKEIPYRAFSYKTHLENFRRGRPSVCQFELTFRCGLHCRHCYSDCYNTASAVKKELTTAQVFSILDKLRQAGVSWLCLTGGDPLARRDFLEIYTYAKKQGLIVTIFTNGYSMTEKIARALKKSPPFVIEMTLNAITEEIYEKISQVRGSYKKALQGIRLIQQAGLPLRIKTQVTKDNLSDLPAIEHFVRSLGLEFQAGADLHAALDGDVSPTKLRITPEQAFKIKAMDMPECSQGRRDSTSAGTKLFRCAIAGGDGIFIDPYGDLVLCVKIRTPSLNVLDRDVLQAAGQLLSSVGNRRYLTKSKCKQCRVRDVCPSCPGMAQLETGDLEAPIDYYCKLSRLIRKQKA